MITNEFLKLAKIETPTDTRLLNVTAFSEELTFGGKMRRTFGRTMVSTLFGPKREWTATIEFLTGADYEDFLRFIALAIDPVTLGPTAFRSVFMLAGGVNTALRRSGAAVKVWIEPQRAGIFEYQTTGAVLTTGWTLDVLIHEA